MKHGEFYRKCKTSYPAIVDPIFSKKNWWQIILMTVVGVLIEPLIMYGRQRTVPSSPHFYLQRIEYLSCMVIPFFAFLFWMNWRESEKRTRGYGWIGKFEVIGKRSSLLFCSLLLAPGSDHRLKVDRSLFDKTRIGDFILIQRNSFGNIESVTRAKNFSRRLAKARRFPKTKQKDFGSLKG